MSAKVPVLFVCIHNSARSQMAEAWLNHLHGDHFAAQSAGLEAGTLHPMTTRVMQEVGIDLEGKATQSVFDLFKSGSLFSYVITVCDETAAERCPVFPGLAKRKHWSFADPAAFVGTEAEQLKQFRKMRDRIRRRVDEWARRIIQRRTSEIKTPPL